VVLLLVVFGSVFTILDERAKALFGGWALLVVVLYPDIGLDIRRTWWKEGFGSFNVSVLSVCFVVVDDGSSWDVLYGLILEEI
jgi:hypothetical protein